MFIDRIIDRICFLSVTLTTEPLNPHQFEASCTGGRGMRLPFGSPKFSHQTVSTTQTPLYYTIARYILIEIHFFIVSTQIGQ